MKVCTDCKETKPLDSYYYQKKRGTYFTQCKACISEQRKEARLVRGEQLRERNRQYYYANRERVIKRQTEYQRGNENRKAYLRAWKKANKEKLSVKAAAYRSTPEYRAWRSEYCERNADTLSAYHKERRKNNPERYQLNSRRYYEANKEKVLTNCHRRKARLLGNGGNHTEAEWRELLEKYGNACVYCSSLERLSRDHKTPLARGGTNDIDNILPACLPCNLSKGRKTYEEFIEWRNRINS